MAGNSTGKWVARAAATGGSRSYRGQRPVNWYLSLFLIVVLGVTLVLYSRFERQHPYTGSASGPPTTSDTWHVGFAFDICGKVENPPAATPNASNFGIVSAANGIITVAPKVPDEAGHNAILGRYVSNYKGMQLSGSSLLDPAAGTKPFSNGETCPKGTPDVGKVGKVSAKTWTSVQDNTGKVVSGNPANILFANGQMITVAFLPAGAVIPKPQASVIEALLTATTSSSSPTTSTPVASTPTTTAPSVPPASSTTTTAKTTTTTAKTTTPTSAKTNTPTSAKSTTSTSASGGGTKK